MSIRFTNSSDKIICRSHTINIRISNKKSWNATYILTLLTIHYCNIPDDSFIVITRKREGLFWRKQNQWTYWDKIKSNNFCHGDYIKTVLSLAYSHQKYIHFYDIYICVCVYICVYIYVCVCIYILYNQYIY